VCIYCESKHLAVASKAWFEIQQNCIKIYFSKTKCHLIWCILFYFIKRILIVCGCLGTSKPLAELQTYMRRCSRI
jgi:hypothetical protein